MENTLARIESKNAKIGVIGLGYVGFSVAIEFARQGFSVVGIDIDKEKIYSIQQGNSAIPDISDQELKRLISNEKIVAVKDFDRLKEVDVIIICVPTPLRKSKEPDLFYVLNAVEQIKNRIRKGQLIILESTTYPGTTEDVISAVLTGTGLKVGEDFCLAFSPERLDPGNKEYNIRNTPKIVGGVTTKCQEVASTLYSQIVEEVVPVSSPCAAELVKLLENTFRAVNIGLINEMAIICNKLGVETGEVIRAAATKPFGFMSFTPGPGLGGHCIPLDPHYLSWKLKSLKYHPKFIQLADEVNTSMPSYVISRIVAALNQMSLSVKGIRILVMGVTYKKDVGDCRESPAFNIMEELVQLGAKVSYHDPFISKLELNNMELLSQSISSDSYSDYDCVVILTDHSSFDYDAIIQKSRLVFDTRNVTFSNRSSEGKVFRL